MRIAPTIDGAMTVVEQRSQDGQARRRRRLLVAVEVRVGDRVRREVDARQQRLVAGPVVEVRGRHARRPERPAVEPAAEGDDPGPAGDPPRELERAVDGLGAGVQEHHRVERRPGTSPRAPSRAREIGSVNPIALIGPIELVDLGVDRRGHPRMGVAERA